MRQLFVACVALAVLGYCTAQVPAQEQIKTGGTVITKTEVQSSPAPRTGPFRRLRDRDTVTTGTPMTTTTKVETVPATPPATTTTTTAQVSEPRTGLLARLRGRLGR